MARTFPWSGAWCRMLWRLSVVLALALMASANATSIVLAQPPGGPPGKGPPKSPEEFFERERTKLLEKREREGSRFDAERELQKLQEKFQKDYGEPLPESRLREFQSVVRESRTARDSTGTRATASRSSSTRKPFQRGTRYVDGLPNWFAERDADRDGQVGMYEWPRGELTEFTAWDLNRDGLVEQSETLRRLRQLAPPSSRSKTPMGMSGHSVLPAKPDEPRSASVSPAPTEPPKPKPPPGKPTTPEEFLAKEAPKLADKVAREGERFDAEREFQKLRDKYRKDLGDDMPAAIEDDLRRVVRHAQDEALLPER